jgi:hypothetical protein
VSPPTAAASDPLVTVAVIGGTDVETRTIVEEVLASLGIAPVIEGSAVYGVQVHSQQEKRARDALRTEPRLANHWIQFVDEAPK